ncbi:MAG: DUF4870 domain-containing protein [Eubacteriales bacterium]
MTNDNQERNWAVFCHLGGLSGYVIPFGNIVLPLVFWLINKDKYPFVDYHGKESVNFNISMILYALISGVLCLILIGFVLLAGLVIFQIVNVIRASVEAGNGRYFQYPLTIRFIK